MFVNFNHQSGSDYSRFDYLPTEVQREVLAGYVKDERKGSETIKHHAIYKLFDSRLSNKMGLELSNQFLLEGRVFCDRYKIELLTTPFKNFTHNGSNRSKLYTKHNKSYTLYVELLNDDGSVHSKKKIPVPGGRILDFAINKTGIAFVATELSSFFVNIETGQFNEVSKVFEKVCLPENRDIETHFLALSQRSAFKIDFSADFRPTHIINYADIDSNAQLQNVIKKIIILYLHCIDLSYALPLLLNKGNYFRDILNLVKTFPIVPILFVTILTVSLISLIYKNIVCPDQASDTPRNKYRLMEHKITHLTPTEWFHLTSSSPLIFSLLGAIAFKSLEIFGNPLPIEVLEARNKDGWHKFYFGIPYMMGTIHIFQQLYKMRNGSIDIKIKTA